MPRPKSTLPKGILEKLVFYPNASEVAEKLEEAFGLVQSDVTVTSHLEGITVALVKEDSIKSLNLSWHQLRELVQEYGTEPFREDTVKSMSTDLKGGKRNR